MLFPKAGRRLFDLALIPLGESSCGCRELPSTSDRDLYLDSRSACVSGVLSVVQQTLYMPKAKRKRSVANVAAVPRKSNCDQKRVVKMETTMEFREATKAEI